jgi:hypothetical protein
MFGSSYDRTCNCVLLDQGTRCVLPESLQGYQAALGGEHNLVSETDLSHRLRCRIAILPAFEAIAPSVVSILLRLLEQGSNLLLESGAGFLSLSEFVSHQRMLDRYFNIAIGPPIDLWTEQPADGLLVSRQRGNRRRKLDRHQSVPYIAYRWPRETIVRDFSRVIPVSAKFEDVIATIGACSVGVKRSIGKGTLILLGSLLGPTLHAHDLEAQSWLQSVTRL